MNRNLEDYLKQPEAAAIELPIRVPVQFLCEQVIGADIRYWCGELTWPKDQDPEKVLPVKLREHNDTRDRDRWERPAMLDWERAIKVAFATMPYLLDVGEMDAQTGDLWIQLAAFGEVRYG